MTDNYEPRPRILTTPEEIEEHIRLLSEYAERHGTHLGASKGRTLATNVLAAVVGWSVFWSLLCIGSAKDAIAAATFLLPVTMFVVGMWVYQLLQNEKHRTSWSSDYSVLAGLRHYRIQLKSSTDTSTNCSTTSR